MIMAVLMACLLVLCLPSPRAASCRYSIEASRQARRETRQLAAVRGEIVKIDDVNVTYSRMENGWNDAEDDAQWRNIFLGALIGVYALNLVDILLSEPDTGERAEPNQTSLEWHGDGLRLVRTIHF